MRSRRRERPRPLTILYEDDRVVVVSKPPGVLSVLPPKSDRKKGRSYDTVANRMKATVGTVLPAHRIDEQTSGVLVCARDAQAKDALMTQFKQKAVQKSYWALVQGSLRRDEGTLEFPIKDLGAHATIAPDGQNARTRYRVLKRFPNATMVGIDLDTGRHNQIRLHFAHIGHPLVGERKYAYGRDAIVRHKRTALHAESLTFTSLISGDRIKVQAPLSKDLLNLLDKLESP